MSSTAIHSRVVLDVKATPRHVRAGEGAFISLKSGRIVHVFTRYGSKGADHDAAVIVARHSDDGGRTWSGRDRLILANEGKCNVMSTSLLRLANGRIVLFYLRKDGCRKCMPKVRFSDDEAKTFGEPLNVVPEPGYHVLNNDRVVRLSTGRLVMPLALHRQRGTPTPGEVGISYAGMVLFYFSDDQGRTWCETPQNLYACFPHAGGLQEPGVIEKRDGSLIAWMRTNEHNPTERPNYQWHATSKDGGMTWSEPKRWKPFVSPCSPMSIKRLRSGALLAVWNDRRVRINSSPPHRTPLVMALSRDDGRTWREHRTIEKDPRLAYCYTAIHETDDAVLLSYMKFEHGLGRLSPHTALRVRRVTGLE